MGKVKRKNDIKVFKLGVLVMAGSIVLLFAILFFKYYQSLNSKNENINKDQSSQKDTKEEDENLPYWSSYINEDYLIKFSYPYLLHKVDYEDSGEYEFFIVFEENQFSKEKGVAFGVSSNGLEKEIIRIKSEVSLQGQSNLVKEEEIFLSSIRGKILEFDPEEDELEQRSFFVFEKGDYTFSFSTVPEQIQRLIESIDYLSAYE